MDDALGLYTAGDLDQAGCLTGQLLSRQGELAEAWALLGKIAHRQAHNQEALLAFERVVVLRPEDFVGWFRLGQARDAQQDRRGAEAAYRQALCLRPDDRGALNNLALALLAQGRAGEALSLLQLALQTAPDCAATLFNRAAVLERLGRGDEAAASLARAARLEPAWSAPLEQLVRIRVDQGNFPAAGEFCEKICLQRPENLLWQLRRATIGPSVWEDNAAIDRGRQELCEVLQQLASRPWKLDPADIVRVGWRPPMWLAYQGRDEKPLRMQLGSLLSGKLPRACLHTREGKPRVGFVVAAGHERVFLRGMSGLLQRLSPERVETVVIGDRTARNLVTDTVAGSQVRFMSVPPDPIKAAEWIAATGFDLLYYWEIGTEPLNYFLPMLRPAAVQCTSWGWPVTSGLAEVDYFISCDALEPPGAQRHFRERLIRLRNLPLWIDPPGDSIEPLCKGDLGIAPGRRLYLCCQNPRKMHPDFDPLVAEILRRDRGGVFAFVEASRPVVTRRLIERLERTLAEVRDRVIVLPRRSADDYRRLIAGADVVLDTPHYSGGANTNYDCFVAGVPVVTLPGEFHRGRFTAACYEMMGISGCTAHTAEEYVAGALRIADNPDLRRRIGQQLRDTHWRVFANPAVVDPFEQLLLELSAVGRERVASDLPVQRSTT